MVAEAGGFLVNAGVDHHFKDRTSDSYSQASSHKPSKSDGIRLCELRGRTGFRERHGARILMTSNFTEYYGGEYDLEPR